MKILLASSSSGSRGGGELYLVYLGGALAARGHEVVFRLSSHPQMDELAGHFEPIGTVVRSDYRNTYHRRLRALSTVANLTTSSRIAYEWQAIAPDLIHVNKQNLEDGLDLLRAATKSGIPSVATIHLSQSATYLGAKSAWVRDVVARRALRAYHGTFITVQEQRADDLVDFVGSRPRVVAIHNGVPVLDSEERVELRNAKREELGIAPDEQLILGLGRMVPQKRPELFLDKALALCEAVPNARVIWIGEGGHDSYEKEWDRRVGEAQVGNRIQRLPWQAEVFPLLAAGDVFLHVAAYEGMPLALFEAMSAGLPCVISENLLSDMPFLDRTHVLVTEDATDWVDLLGDRTRLDQVAAAGRQLVVNRFSHDRMAATYEDVYHKETGASA